MTYGFDTIITVKLIPNNMKTLTHVAYCITVILLTTLSSCTIDKGESAGSISLRSCTDVANPTVQQVSTTHPYYVAFINSAAYATINFPVLRGTIDPGYMYLRDYRIRGEVSRYQALTMRIAEPIVAHSDTPYYRQILLHAIWDTSKTNPDYAMVCETFTTYYNEFEYYAVIHPNVPFSGEHTYRNVQGDSLQHYIIREDTINATHYFSNDILYLSSYISAVSLRVDLDCIHNDLVLAAHSFHWYPVINRIYTPITKRQIDIDGALLNYLH